MDVVDGVALAVELAAGDGVAKPLDGGDFTHQLGHRQGEITRAGIEFQNAILFVERAGFEELVQHQPVRAGVDLSEGVGVEFER